jgi:predicted DNA-binding transcriptional regulator AlpA
MAVTLDKAFLTVEDLAELFCVRPLTVLAWHRAGRLPKPIKLGKRLAWKQEQVDELKKGPKPKGAK